jgi:transcription antitermination factor NusG
MGWPELYKKNGEGIIPHDTMAYAEKFLKKCSIIECGQNNDLNSKKIAYQSIINTLIYFGFIEGKIKSKPLAIVQMKSLFIREHNEDKLSTKWGNFDKFKKGDVLACKADGEIILAPFDGVIILPNSKAKIGTEWFYLGLIK